MGLDLDIQIQVKGFNGQELRRWISSWKQFLREADALLAEREVQVEKYQNAIDENGNPIPLSVIQAIRSESEAKFMGFGVVDVNDPRYKYGLLERIPSVETPQAP